MYERLQDIARAEILKGLRELTEANHEIFRRMYAAYNRDTPLEDVVLNTPEDKLSTAMRQVDNSVKDLRAKKAEKEPETGSRDHIEIKGTVEVEVWTDTTGEFCWGFCPYLRCDYESSVFDPNEVKFYVCNLSINSVGHHKASDMKSRTDFCKKHFNKNKEQKK